MGIGYPTDLDDAAWAAHDLAINQCRGAVCVAVIARFFAERDQREDSINKLEIACGFDANGTFRGWLRGNLPGPTSIATVRRETGGAVDLTAWVHHPLWELLRKLPPGLRRLNRILEERSTRVREVLYLEPDAAGQFSHHTPDHQTTVVLRDLGDLDAFVAMLCLARRGEWEEDEPNHAHPGMCAYDMFPHVMASEPLLHGRWELLVECLHRIFWARQYPRSRTLNLSLSKLTRRVEHLRTHPLAKFRLCSGRRLSPKQELAQRREQLEYEEKRLKDERNSRRRERAQWRRLQAASERLFGPGNGIAFLEDGMPDPPEPEWEPAGEVPYHGGQSASS